MKAFLSLHTDVPTETNEATYKGYQRQTVDYHDKLGNTPVEVMFPEATEDSEELISYLRIMDEKGDLIKGVHMMPHLKVQKGDKPRIIIANEPAFPENINPIARMAWLLVYHKELDPASLHPALYEAINDALVNVGMPVIPVVRSGTAHMKGKLSNMPSFEDLTIGGNA